MFKKKGSKYNNKKAEAYGFKWDSQMELEYYEYILELQKQGQVTNIERQVTFTLQDGFEFQGKKIRPITYKADFVITYSDGKEIVWDVKGQILEVFKLKVKLLRFRYRDIDFRCVRSRGRKPNKVWEEVKI